MQRAQGEAPGELCLEWAAEIPRESGKQPPWWAGHSAHRRHSCKSLTTSVSGIALQQSPQGQGPRCLLSSGPLVPSTAWQQANAQGRSLGLVRGKVLSPCKGQCGFRADGCHEGASPGAPIPYGMSQGPFLFRNRIRKEEKQTIWWSFCLILSLNHISHWRGSVTLFLEMRQEL